MLAVIILKVMLIVLAVPIGLLIAWLARDELVSGRIWFQRLILLSVLVGIIFYLRGESYVGWTCAFVIILSLVGYVKSFDPYWTGKRKIKKTMRHHGLKAVV